jgi:hypothetical protein
MEGIQLVISKQNIITKTEKTVTNGSHRIRIGLGVGKPKSAQIPTLRTEPEPLEFNEGCNIGTCELQHVVSLLFPGWCPNTSPLDTPQPLYLYLVPPY